MNPDQHNWTDEYVSVPNEAPPASWLFGLVDLLVTIAFLPLILIGNVIDACWKNDSARFMDR